VNAEQRFWALAEPLLARPGVARSTMMGFPCLRLHGDFFASCDPRTGGLVVKVDAERSARLIDLGQAEEFAPNGRRFRQWANVPGARHRAWRGLLNEALDSAAARHICSHHEPDHEVRTTYPDALSVKRVATPRRAPLDATVSGRHLQPPGLRHEPSTTCEGRPIRDSLARAHAQYQM